MKSGNYRVSFIVELNNCENQEEASQAVGEMVKEAIDDESFPEVDFELVEEFDIEYQTDEEDVEELNFDGML